MQLRLFLIFLLSHFIADFPLQSKQMCESRFPNKKKYGTKSALRRMLQGNLKHCSVHFIVLAVMTVPLLIFYYSDSNLVDGLFRNQVVLKCAIFLISHFLIDFVKSYVTYRCNAPRYSFYFFMMDQFLHFMVLGLLFWDRIGIWWNQFVTEWQQETITMLLFDRFLFSCSIVLFATFFTGIFIRIFMDYLDLRNQKQVNTESKKNETLKSKGKKDDAEIVQQPETNVQDGEILEGGYIIGILERCFILCAFVVNSLELIGFMLTVKTIVRLSKLSKDKFQEYFLIGNLLSFLFAIFSGILLHHLW